MLPSTGSGKLGTPCERMHWANATMLLCTLVGLSVDGPPFSAFADVLL
jgi:hypothetical protein